MRRRRADLGRDEIVAAALQIVDRDGVDALSMRALAAELQAATMATYNYVKDKEELLGLVCDEVMAQNPPPDLSIDEWDERLRSYALATWRTLSQRPWLGELQLRQGTMSRPAQFEVQKLLLVTFGHAGFDAEGSRYALGAFMAFMVGSQRVPGERTPRDAGSAGHSSRSSKAEQHFRFGLETLIDGLRCQLEKATGGPAGTSKRGMSS